jgi:hypothetical protein
LFDGGNIVQEHGAGGYVTANLLTGLGLDETLLRSDSSGTYSFLTNLTNSTVALADSDGNISAQYAYDPFGNTTHMSFSAMNDKGEVYLQITWLA